MRRLGDQCNSARIDVCDPRPVRGPGEALPATGDDRTNPLIFGRNEVDEAATELTETAELDRKLGAVRRPDEAVGYGRRPAQRAMRIVSGCAKAMRSSIVS